MALQFGKRDNEQPRTPGSGMGMGMATPRTAGYGPPQSQAASPAEAVRALA